jgi:hypothetical protein
MQSGARRLQRALFAQARRARARLLEVVEHAGGVVAGAPAPRPAHQVAPRVPDLAALRGRIQHAAKRGRRARGRGRRRDGRLRGPALPVQACPGRVTAPWRALTRSPPSRMRPGPPVRPRRAPAQADPPRRALPWPGLRGPRPPPAPAPLAPPAAQASSPRALQLWTGHASARPRSRWRSPVPSVPPRAAQPWMGQPRARPHGPSSSAPRAWQACRARTHHSSGPA